MSFKIAFNSVPVCIFFLWTSGITLLLMLKTWYVQYALFLKTCIHFTCIGSLTFDFFYLLVLVLFGTVRTFLWFALSFAMQTFKLQHRWRLYYKLRLRTSACWLQLVRGHPAFHHNFFSWGIRCLILASPQKEKNSCDLNFLRSASELLRHSRRSNAKSAAPEEDEELTSY